MFIEKYGEPGGPIHMGDLVRMATSEMVKDDILQPGWEQSALTFIFFYDEIFIFNTSSEVCLYPKK